MQRTIIFFIIVLSASMISSSFGQESNKKESISIRLIFDEDYSLKQNTFKENKGDELSENARNEEEQFLLTSTIKNESRGSTEREYFSPLMHHSSKSAPDHLVHDTVSYHVQEHQKSSHSTDSLQFPSMIHEAFLLGSAFFTNFTLHEMGHKILADDVGAKVENFSILKKQGDEFFLGVSSFKEIDDESIMPYSLAGEVAADITFEHALRSYRQNPSLYNKSLLFFSGTDFLWYCAYAFYLNDGHEYYDPVALSRETGMSRDTIFSIALAKTMINAYRIYSGKDYIIPYFAVDTDAAYLNIDIPFEIN